MNNKKYRTLSESSLQDINGGGIKSFIQGMIYELTLPVRKPRK